MFFKVEEEGKKNFKQGIEVVLNYKKSIKRRQRYKNLIVQRL